MTKCFLCLASLLLVAGCASEAGFEMPELGPLVARATPEGLKAAASSRDEHSDGLLYLRNFFRSQYPKLSGDGEVTGFLSSPLDDFDERLAGLNVRAKEIKKECLYQDSRPYRVDATGIHPVLDLELDLQCRDFITKPDGKGNGSGYAFGKTNTSFSLWFHFKEEGKTDAFSYYAKLSERGTDDELVDAILLENATVEKSLLRTMRMKAWPVRKRLEIVYTSTRPEIGNSHLGCGFQMVASESLVYARGRVIPQGQPLDCQTSALLFETCAHAADLTLASTGTCDELKKSFTLTGTEDFDYNEVVGKASLIDNALPVTNSGLVTSLF